MPAKSRRSRYKMRATGRVNASTTTWTPTVDQASNMEARTAESPAASIPAPVTDERGRVLQEMKMIALVTGVVTVLLVVLYILFR